MRWGPSTGSRCVATHRRWRCVASPWRSSASMGGRANFYGGPPAPSVPTSRYPGLAEAEVALLMRDLRGSAGGLTAAIRILEAHADRANALQARVISARRLLLLGRLN